MTCFPGLGSVANEFHRNLFESQQTTGIVHQQSIYLVLAVAPPSHQRHDIAKDMAISVTPESFQTRAVTDVMRDEQVLQVTVIDKETDQP